MKRLRTMSIALLLAAASRLDAQPPAPAPATGSPVPVDRVVAVVGSTPILLSDVLAQVNTVRASGQQVPTDSAGQVQLMQQLLGRLIDEELVLQRAQAAKVEVTDNEVNTAVDQRAKQVRDQFQTEQAFLDELKKAGFGNLEEYRRWLVDQQRRVLMQQKLFEKLRQEGKLVPVPVSEAEITEFFDKNKAELPRLPATVSFRQIVIAPKASEAARKAAQAKAESLLAEVRKGGDFDKIAKRESMDPGSKDVGGDLGWRRRGDFVPEFERWSFALTPGQLSPVFETPHGFHVLRVDRVQPAEVKVRHILIRPTVDSADVAAGRRSADSVAALLRGGAKYDDLVAKFHDPVEEKIIPSIPRDTLPESYRKGIEGKKANDITDPFQIDDPARGVPKFVIAQLTSVSEAHEPSPSDYREQIRARLVEERSMRRFLDILRKETYVEERLSLSRKEASRR